MGFPGWVIQWIRSFITSRTARMCFDGGVSELLEILAGVPQGSPVSPILFILYIASLYWRLQEIPGLLVVGFADDTNIMAFSPDPRENCKRLADAWRVCAAWAETRGMEFAPQKSELIHFTRAQAPCMESIYLGTAEIKPAGKARFLGVWLDRKLRWKEHFLKTKEKMATQKVALTRLAASAWGISVPQARMIYTTVVRSAIAYGAAAWHKPTEKGYTKGIAQGLLPIQTQCLRAVSGAYKATPRRQLETETGVPPLGLYLDRCAAGFEIRSASNGAAKILRNNCRAVDKILLGAEILRKGARRIRIRNNHAAGTATNRAMERHQWGQGWMGRSSPREALEEKWKAAWEQWRQANPQQSSNVPANRPPDLRRGADGYKGLLKHEASILMQARTEKIGLRSFLFQRKVPGVETPRCRCGQAPETAEHLILYCEELHEKREELRRELAPTTLRTRRDLMLCTEKACSGGAIARWLLRTDRFPQYGLAGRIAADTQRRDTFQFDPG